MGALSPLEDETNLYETDKEKTLYAPRQITWRSLAEDCAEEGLGVNLFIGSQRPVDLGTLG
jgi:protein transport protein SEC24